MTSLLAASVLALAGAPDRGAPDVHAETLHGVWMLETFTVHDAQERPQPWGFDVNGLLIYTADGHVSVAINRYAPWNSFGRPDQPAEASVRSLFYAGRYEVQGASVTHTVEVASDPARVGTPQKRAVILEGDRLILVTEEQSIWAQLVWRRV